MKRKLALLLTSLLVGLIFAASLSIGLTYAYDAYYSYTNPVHPFEDVVDFYGVALIGILLFSFAVSLPTFTFVSYKYLKKPFRC